MIFTNSADQLRAALDRNDDKEMAVEAVGLSSARDTLIREEWDRLVSPANEASADDSLNEHYE